MPDKIGNNKRVLKNTVYLYVRMLITVFVSLYTSRVVLQYLGVVDFGILNVVGALRSCKNNEYCSLGFWNKKLENQYR